MAHKTVNEETKEQIAEVRAEEVLELDGLENFLTPNLSIDLMDFNTGTITHIGSTAILETAIAMADEAEVSTDQMIRVTPMVYFRLGE